MDSRLSDNPMSCDIPLPAKPPIQASKPMNIIDSRLGIPDFESINFSVISDASEFDSVNLHGAQNGVARNYPPFSPFSTKITPTAYPQNKHLVSELHDLTSSRIKEAAEENFKCNVNRTSIQNLVSPTSYDFGSSNGILDTNGEYIIQNIIGVNNNFEKIKSATACQSLPNLSSQSDSVILVPQQLHFPENSTIVGDIPKKDLEPSHSMNRDKQLRNRSLDRRENQSAGTNNQQGLQSTNLNKLNFPQSSSLNSNIVNAKENVSSEILTLFLDQNEKIKQLETQVKAMQQQTDTATIQKQETVARPFEDKTFKVMNDNIYSILQYIKDHDSTIYTLKDQVSILAKKIDQLESKSKNNTFEPIDLSNAKGGNKSNSMNDSPYCHNETHVKKIASSTMTSVTMDGNEKVLFSKTTVVTENCKDFLLPHSQNKDPSTHLNKSGNNSGRGIPNCCLCNKCTILKSPDSKKVKRSKGAVKAVTGHENGTLNATVNSPVIPAVKFRTSNHKNSSPLSDCNLADKDMNVRQSPQERNLPTYNSIVKNIDNLILKEDDEALENYRHSCHCKENICSGSGTSLAKRKSRIQKNCGECAYNSEDSDYVSPNSGLMEDDAFEEDNWYDLTKKKYGIPSTLMSVDTQQYLEKHRLCNNVERWTSKKSRSPHVKQNIR